MLLSGPAPSQVLEVLYGLRLHEAIMTEAKQPERGVGGGRVRRKKGGRKATTAGRGEAEVNAGALLAALLRPHGAMVALLHTFAALQRHYNVANVHDTVSNSRPRRLVGWTPRLNMATCDGWQCRTRTRGGRCSRRHWRPCSRRCSGS